MSGLHDSASDPPVGFPARFEVWLVTLDPTRGSEIRKTRPAVVVSPDEMNRHIRTVIIAPMTTAGRAYPTRVAVTFEGKDGQVALDQIRTVDKKRLVKRLEIWGQEIWHRKSGATILNSHDPTLALCCSPDDKTMVAHLVTMFGGSGFLGRRAVARLVQ